MHLLGPILAAFQTHRNDFAVSENAILHTYRLKRLAELSEFNGCTQNNVLRLIAIGNPNDLDSAPFLRIDLLNGFNSHYQLGSD